MKQYLDLCRHILGPAGNTRGDRTGTGTRSVFGYQMRFDLKEGFPMVTTKKLHLRGIIHELLWFIQGSTNNEALRANKVTIWDEWAIDEDITTQVPYNDYERAGLLAEKLKISFEQARRKLSAADQEAKASEGWDGDLQQGGKKLLAEHEIPTHKTVVVIPKGDLGPIYGRQWRSWRGPRGQVVDQIAELIRGLKKNPWSRRHIVSAWNPIDLPDESITPQENVKQGKMALAACHCLFQFYVRPMSQQERIDLLNERIASGQFEYTGPTETMDQHLDDQGIPDKKLDCQLYQRSADTFLGVPFNIASYALLTHMVAQVCNMDVGEFIWTGGDTHIYKNHFEQVALQLTRDPLPLPKLKLNPAIKDIDDFKFEDIEVIGYQSHEKIAAPISV